MIVVAAELSQWKRDRGRCGYGIDRSSWLRTLLRCVCGSQIESERTSAIGATLAASHCCGDGDDEEEEGDVE